MNEFLLKAIVRLFAIVAKERVSDLEKENIKSFILREVNEGEVEEYLSIFDEFSKQIHIATEQETPLEEGQMDGRTAEFIEDWANIILICKHINTELTEFQKIVLILRLIELISMEDNSLSERQDIMIYYICQTINISSKTVKLVQNFIFAHDVTSLRSPNYLVIDSGTKDVHAPCKHIQRPQLTGFIAILYIDFTESYFIKYVGLSNIRLNGITLASRAIEVFPPGSNIRGDKLQPVYYSDVVANFKAPSEKARVSLVADDVFLKFKSGGIGLREIRINEESGKLVGIMGASGSGKSTLLDVLNGRYKPFRGKVLINGIDLHKNPEELEGLIGHVPQDDLLMEELTVFENLYYAAKLCLANYSDEELMERVETTLEMLGILGIRDLRVGNPLNKTISGGQRKRLNIGLELIREPAILFLDEPTSGLSSRDSENIVDLLKELSLKGKLVFAVIHQPSSDIFKMFDRLLILDVGGHEIYYGNPVEAVVYFRNAMHMVQRDQGSCVNCGNVKTEQIFNIIETRKVNEYGQLTNQRKFQPKDWAERFKKVFKFKPDLKKYNLPKTTFKIPGKVDQFVVFIRRDFLSKVKNRQYMVVNFMEAPILALIIGYFIKYYDVTADGIQHYVFRENPNIPTYFFMSIIVALFLGLSISGEEIIKDRKILAREKFLNLSRGSYLASKVAILFAISAIQMITYVLVANYLLEFKSMNMAYWLVLFSAACFANAVGLNISSAFNSVITIYILVPIILIPQLMFNGTAIPFDKLNPRITSIDKVPILGELMTSKWAYEAIMVHQYKYNLYDRWFYDLDKGFHNAQYHSIYRIPELQTSLEQCAGILRVDAPKGDYSDQFALLHNEIGNEIAVIGEDKFPYLDRLHPGAFDSTTYIAAQNLLGTLKRMYLNQSLEYEKRKNQLLAELTDTEYKRSKYYSIRDQYKNDKIEETVTNRLTNSRIVRYKDKLVRKYQLVYADPTLPDNPLNFRTHYFAPTKYFAGFYVETFWFNVAVIWVMTLFMLIALYYDLLKRLILTFERLTEYNIGKYVRANQAILRRRMGK
jgi:ABC-type multidrug transport system ATPase subunit